MKLDEFVANVLKDINNGLVIATGATNRGYKVKVTEDGGVNFDIAVTTSYTNAVEGSGSAKVGFIEVLGAGVGVKASGTNENSEVSRIQFSISVPARTKEEEAQESRRIQEYNEQNRSGAVRVGSF